MTGYQLISDQYFLIRSVPVRDVRIRYYFSKDNVTAMKLDSSDELNVVSEVGKTNYFVPWNKYKMVQSSLQIMYAADAPEFSRALQWNTSQSTELLCYPKLDLGGHTDQRAI